MRRCVQTFDWYCMCVCAVCVCVRYVCVFVCVCGMVCVWVCVRCVCSDLLFRQGPEPCLVVTELHVEAVHGHLERVVLIHQLLGLLTQTLQLRRLTYRGRHHQNCFNIHLYGALTEPNLTAITLMHKPNLTAVNHTHTHTHTHTHLRERLEKYSR